MKEKGIFENNFFGNTSVLILLMEHFTIILKFKMKLNDKLQLHEMTAQM